MKYLTHTKKALFSALFPMTFFILQACGEKNTETSIEVALLNAQPTHSGEQAYVISKDSKWVLGVEQGLSIYSGDKVIEQLPIYGEYLDVRKNANGTSLAITMNKSNQLTLIKVDAEMSSFDVKNSKPFNVPLEGLCLYQPEYEGLQAFLIGEDHMAYQVLIGEAENTVELKLIRTLPMPPGSEYCSVDDQRHHLYVNEEDIGVWRYNARSESMIKRELVELLAPKGRLIENSGPISVIEDTLLLAEKGGSLIHSYSLNESVSFQQTYQLPTEIVIDGMNANLIERGQGVITLLDEASEQLLHTTLPVLQTKKKNAIVQIEVDVETHPVDKKGDAADDPAVWVNTSHPEKSRILGTNKKQGLFVYDLKGDLLQSLLVDRVNNVDIRKGFTYKGKAVDIAAASQRDRHAIALFKIDPDNGNVTVAEEIVTTLDDVYGMCMSKGKNEEIFVFINDEDGRYEQWQVIDSDDGWSGKKVREFSVNSQPEGCTVDEKAQRLFVGEEAKGVWTLGAMPNDSTEMQLIAEVDENGSGLVADVEGMEIYQTDTLNWLVVSSQGDDSYVIYEANAPYTLIGKFRLGMNAALEIDGVSETDGLTVTSAALGAAYPAGVMVAQDGRNHMPEANQNFKLVDWQKIQQAMTATH